MIHVVFCSSAAGTLRQALRARGRRERVVELTESLDWGPIGPTGLFESRGAWLNRNIPWGADRSWADDQAWDNMGWDWLHSGPRQFQSKVDDDPNRLIWLAPGSAREQCGLYWYLDRFGGKGASIILADAPMDGAWRGLPPAGLGELNVENIGTLLDQAPRQAWDTECFPELRWGDLCAEGSLLRIVKRGMIKSVPEDLFDVPLLARCTQSWQKNLRVVGEAMVDLWGANHRVDDVFLNWRLRVLAEQGKIVSTGEITAFPDLRSGWPLIRSASQ